MYLDNAATTPLNSKVKEYIISILDDFGNPSSTYELGRKTKNIISESREKVCKFINAESSDDIIFTSSGSASNTLAIKGVTKNNKNYELYYSTISHKSIIYSCMDCNNSHELKVNEFGEIDLKELRNSLMLKKGSMPIVVIDAANSETGIVRNVKKISNLVHLFNGIIIVDFTGYIPSYEVDVKTLDVDIATFSGHKLGALKGIGVLYKKKNIQLCPLIYGSQEQGLFAGTENIIGIASIGVAVENYSYKNISCANRDYVYYKLTSTIKDCYLIGRLSNRLPHNLYICFKNVDANSLVSLLDLQGIQVSTGSACNNYNKTPSNTLLKLGINNDDLYSCIRITFSGKESESDLINICKTIKNCVNYLRSED